MNRTLTLAVVTLLLALWLTEGSQAERILMLSPLGTRSHLNGFMPMVEALAERGHQLTVVTGHTPTTNSSNIQTIIVDGLVEHIDAEWQTFNRQSPLDAVLENLFEFRHLSKIGYTALLANKEFRKVVDNRQVDLVIIDAIMCESVMHFVDQLKVPFIFYSSAVSTPWTLAAMGTSQEYSSAPSPALEFTSQMSFFQRALNAIGTEIFLLLRKMFIVQMMDDLARKEYPNARSISEIERDAALCLANIDFATARVRTLPRTIIPVGAMHVRPSKPLPKEFGDFADEAHQGFIVFTLGSNAKVSAMPEQIKNMFVRVFSRIPQRVFWKWEVDNLAVNTLPASVKIVNWLPQQDLLGHKNARLFISHGGLFGIQEAVYHGIPILGLPLGRDQRHNLALVKENGYGKKLEWEDLTEALLFETIQALLHQPSYRMNAIRMSRLMKDEIVPAKDVAVYWVEHVLRHGGTSHLQSSAKNMPFYQQYLLDIWLFLLLIVSLIFLIVIKLFGWIFRKLSARRKIKKH